MSQNTENKTLNEIASKHLGQSGSYAVYSDTFDSSLLVSMPRELARKDWGITGDEWDFGLDVWHCHESTFLTQKGLPIAGTLKIIYPSKSRLMVESKSIKLYLNSFDMCKLGDGSIQSAIDCYVNQITEDLRNLLEISLVEVYFHPEGSESWNITTGFNNLHNILVDLESLEFDDYKSNQYHLTFDKIPDVIQDTLVFTNTLRSRCRHTKQKDTGSAYIRIQTEGGIVNLESLLKQIVSLREQDEFHEFCAEKLFTDIMKLEGVTGCMVMLLYSRRGSLDINPVRSSHSHFVQNALRSVHKLTSKTQGQ